MTRPEHLNTLTLPASIAAAVTGTATRLERDERHSSETAAEWSVIDRLQRSVLDGYEQEVLTERRVIWHDAASFLAAVPPSRTYCGKDDYNKPYNAMRWDFAHPRLQQIDGLDVVLTVSFIASSPAGLLSKEHQAIFNACAGIEQPRCELRRSLGSIGLQAGPRWRSDPPRDVMASAFSGAFLDSAQRIRGEVWVRPAGETKEKAEPDMSATMERTELERPEAVAWYENGHGWRLLTPEEKRTFEKAACKFSVRGNEPPQPLTLPVMKYFMERHLTWNMDAFRNAADITKLAQECVWV